MQRQQLLQLARLYDVETAYTDVRGERQQAGVEPLLAVLRALGAPVARPADAPAALRARRRAWWQRTCEPVTVAWDGNPCHAAIRLPAQRASGSLVCELHLENGEVRRWQNAISDLPTVQGKQVEGEEYRVKQIPLPQLPLGYHRLRLEMDGRRDEETESLVIAAPRQAYVPPGDEGLLWGGFLPLYAVRSESNWGSGDFTDLGALLKWVEEMGGSLVGTLPLLASFLDEPFEPSPYAPVSRQFWNEFYLDVARVPELASCSRARDLLASTPVQESIAELRAAGQVDYRRGMALKRRVLWELVQSLRTQSGERWEALQRWATAHPQVRDYARFRAVAERQRAGWPAWPGRLRDGHLQPGDCDPEVEAYHLYVQWLAHEQVADAAAQASSRRTGLYLDLPIGVHGGGYDTWRERMAFSLEMSVGAPPDPFFTGGQDWGFPPLHPEGIREQGYGYFIRCLRHHLRHAAALRIDHVAGLHRLFWIPRGMSAEQGVYVRYRAEELYAILCLESHRHHSLIVGEDLGTVPAGVRVDMDRHRLQRMYVLPFETQSGSEEAIRPVPREALCCLNTHDMVPFAAYWEGLAESEPELRAALAAFLHRHGWLPQLTEEPGAVLRGCLQYLSASPARLHLVNLEDLWLEPSPQNVPGTGPKEPNWRRKAQHAREILVAMPGVREVLAQVNRLRREAAPAEGTQPAGRPPEGEGSPQDPQELPPCDSGAAQTPEGTERGR